MKQRRNHRCAACNEIFSFLADPAEDPQIDLKCPYCLKEIKIDFSRYRRNTRSVFRNSEEMQVPAFDFPDPIPTILRVDTEKEEKK